MADPVSIEATRLDLASDVLRGADPFVIEVVVPVITTTITEAGVEAARVQAVASVNGTATGVLTEIATAKADATGAVGAARTAATDAIDTARTAAAGAIGTARSGSLVDIEDAREQALEDIQSAGQGSNSAIGVTFNPTGGISATNVQAALAEVDGEASKRSANLGDLADLGLARQNLALRPGVEVQAYDADLAAIAALTTTALGRSLLTIADEPAGRALLKLVIGTDVQGYDADLQAIAALTTTAFGRDFLALVDAQATRAKLGLGSAATLTAGTSAGNLAPLDGNGKIVTAILPESVLGGVRYQGGWDASANSPALPAPATANRGWYYIVTTAGTTSLSGPAGAITDWQVGDWAVSDGTYWEKVDSSDQVNSVAGLQGTITAANLRAALALVIGTNVQAWDTDLDAIAALTTTAYGRGLLTLTNAAALAAAAGVPSKAAGSDLRTLTDDAKFLTAKSMADAMAFTLPAWAATFVPNWTTGGFNQSLVATGNTTLGGPFVGGSDGEPVVLEYIQDGTGGRTLALNTTYFKLPSALTITASTAANARDKLYGQLRLRSGTFVCEVSGYDKAVA